MKSLKKMRTDLRLTQIELAEKLSVSDRTIQEWEKHGVKKIEDVLKICDFFNIEFLEFLELDQEFVLLRKNDYYKLKNALETINIILNKKG